MNEVNFLPETFLRQQARQARVLRQAALLAVVVVGMATWFFTTRQQARNLETWAESLEFETQARQRQVDEMEKLQLVNLELDKQLRVQRQLEQPIGVSHVVASIGRLMPDAVSVTELTVVGKSPRPVSSGHTKAWRAGEAEAVDVLAINLAGIAPRDADIANFVGALSDHGLFVNVKLRYTRSTELQNLSVREFHLELEVPLDRQFKPVGSLEAADASGK